MKELFEQIETLLGNDAVPGWCSVQKGCALAAMVVALRPAISLEIGVFGGRSLLPMALAHKFVGCGKAVGVDPWDPSASVEGQGAANANWWSSLDYESIYQAFYRASDSLELGPHMEVWRKRSDDVPPLGNVGLLHVDGNHGEQARRDVARFSPHVPVGGVCVLDDLDWEGGAVRESERFLLGSGFVFMYPVGTGAAYRRVA